MANEVYLALLKQSVKAWNAWREESPGKIPDLSEANLSEVDLSGADLTNADLHEANLHGADLCGALLFGANLGNANLNQARLLGAHLRGADLRGTKLIEADLLGAGLREAALIEADLRGANLSRVNFEETNLCKADLSYAVCVQTQFSAVDLSQVIGLETIAHYGPSYVDIQTLYSSQGNISEVFLRGCGVSKKFMVAIADLVGIPREFHSCFISYSHEDKSFVERLLKALENYDITIWWDRGSMTSDSPIHAEIDKGILTHNRYLFTLVPGTI